MNYLKCSKYSIHRVEDEVSRCRDHKSLVRYSSTPTLTTSHDNRTEHTTDAHQPASTHFITKETQSFILVHLSNLIKQSILQRKTRRALRLSPVVSFPYPCHLIQNAVRQRKVKKSKRKSKNMLLFYIPERIFFNTERSQPQRM